MVDESPETKVYEAKVALNGRFTKKIASYVL